MSLNGEQEEYTLLAVRDDVTVWQLHRKHFGLVGVFGLPPPEFHHYDTIAVKPYNNQAAEALLWSVYIAGQLCAGGY